MGPHISDECIGCNVCVDMCPGDVLQPDAERNIPQVAYPEECWYCGVCRLECPVNVVTFEFPITMTKL